eukprot:scaffold2.g7444.t1
MSQSLCIRAPSASLRLPAKISSRARAVQIRCSATTQQQQRQQAAEQQPTATELRTALALLAGGTGAVAGPAAALADEAAPAAEAASSGGLFGLTPLGWAVVFSPLVFYGIFNVNPAAKFGDAVFIFAALVILGNLISILVFKVRLF